MPVMLSFFISVVLVIGFFAGLFGLVVLLVEGRRAKSAPRLGLASGEEPGTLNVWVNWDPTQFAIEIYRLRFQYIAPFSLEKEGTFTFTFNGVQTAPFVQCVELPGRFRTLLEKGKDRGILTVDFRTVTETCIQNTYKFDKVRKILSEEVMKLPKKIEMAANKLSKVKEDVATVLTLDYEELMVNIKRIGELEAAAKAKAAKMAAKPAAAAAPAIATAPVDAPAPVAPQVVAPGPTQSPEATTPVPSDKPVKSVREVVTQQNNKPIEK